MRANLSHCYQEAEREAEDILLPETLACNIRKLSSQIGLSEIESWILAFAILIHSNRLPRPEYGMKTALHKLDKLTLGDFAVLARQHRLRPTALAAECALKTPNKRHPIGFI